MSGTFFATSHGKSTCDGIGGTVKRLTAKASLQRPVDRQILNSTEMFNFCTESIPGVYASVWICNYNLKIYRPVLKLFFNQFC